ncbi:ATP-binding protein [Spirosoma sp. KNUC1025]|uniref:PAS domain-containing sensor histidine kinase n=1 Tax=Spirosoma sp. KNUC1025 TaxID=2894082 RepID=UPI00386AC15A|nr:PAS domain-containing protein [Spirosoma sp. KNUC1025]
MLTEQPADISLTKLLDALPDAVIWMRAIRNHSNQLINFQIDYVNQKALDITNGMYTVSTGTLLLGNNGPEQDEFEKIFQAMRAVLETDQPQEFSYYNPRLDAWLLVNRTRLGDGILSVARNISELKATEQTHARQASLLNNVFDSSSSGIKALEAVRDEKGAIIDFVVIAINKMGAAIRQRTIDEIIGQRILHIFPGVREAGLFEQYAQIVESREFRRIQTRYQIGEVESWYEMALTPFGDGLTVTYTDINETHKARQAVEQSTDELRAVIDSAQVAIFLVSPVRNKAGQLIDFRFRMANQMIAHYVNQEPDALLGELVSRWFPAYLSNGLFKRYVAIFETGRTQHFTFHYATDAVDFWINVSARKLGDDVLVTFSDFTDLKKLQQRLESSAIELQTVIDTSQTGIFLFSPVRNKAGEVVDFRFRVANRQLASYVGQEPDAVIGALGSRWFPDYKTNGLFEAYRKAYITGESQRFDFHYNADGINVWLDILATKMGDEVLVTFSDYTPLKQLQQQLENSVADLQRSNKNLEQFAYVASHDLQEPLRKIQAFGDIVQAQYAPEIGESGADMIRRMQSAAARMQVLIKDVLTYSRIATKRETIGSVDLNELVNNVLLDLETAIADKQANVAVEPLPTVQGDAAQLRQLFQNLISNALKFTMPNTTKLPVVQLTSRQVSGRELTEMMLPSVEADQLFHLIEVIDNGIGFDPNQAERIFQVFQRLHSRSEYQGTGIGLAIVQKVVENHNGYIAAEGRPGKGATFRVALPV